MAHSSSIPSKGCESHSAAAMGYDAQPSFDCDGDTSTPNGSQPPTIIKQAVAKTDGRLTDGKSRKTGVNRKMVASSDSQVRYTPLKSCSKSPERFDITRDDDFESPPIWLTSFYHRPICK